EDAPRERPTHERLEEDAAHERRRAAVAGSAALVVEAEEARDEPRAEDEADPALVAPAHVEGRFVLEAAATGEDAREPAIGAAVDAPVARDGARGAAGDGHHRRQ